MNIKDDSWVVKCIVPRSGGRPGRSNDRECGSHPPIWSQSKQRQTGRAETIFPPLHSPLPLHFINGHSKLLSRHTELTYCRPIRACLFLSHDPSTFPLDARNVADTSCRIVCAKRAWHTLLFACLVSLVTKWQVAASRSWVDALLLTAYSSLTVPYLSLSLSSFLASINLLTAAFIESIQDVLVHTNDTHLVTLVC